MAEEQSFPLPAIWDGAGQIELVARTARELGLRLEPAAAEALAEAIGSDSTRLASELEKLALYSNGAEQITAAAVGALIDSHATSALAVGDALLAGRTADAIALVDALLGAHEPALRIVATLSGQIRGWLWVALLEAAGETDVGTIAKAAGIGNPRRIYVMRKQIRGKAPAQLLDLLSRLLEVEAALKRGFSSWGCLPGRLPAGGFPGLKSSPSPNCLERAAFPAVRQPPIIGPVGRNIRADGPVGSEIRGHLRGGCGAHPGRGATDRPGPGGGARTGDGGVGHGAHHRSAHRHGGEPSVPSPPGGRWTCCSPPASRCPSPCSRWRCTARGCRRSR